MTRNEVRAAARRVTLWHARFSPLFGRREAQEHSLVYVRGLLSDQQRKSIEPIALRFARGPDDAAATQNKVVALQGFITFSPWKEEHVFQEIQAVFAEELMPSAAQSSIGTVGVIDESGFVKAGSESVGVAHAVVRAAGEIRQLPGGRVPGRRDARRHGLPGRATVSYQGRCADKAHRRKTRIPAKVKFQTKPEIAAEMIRRTLAAGKVHFDWITADELYGSSGDFLDGAGGDGPKIRGGGQEEHGRVYGRSGDLARRVPGAEEAEADWLLQIRGSEVGGRGRGGTSARGLAALGLAGRGQGPFGA